MAKPSCQPTQAVLGMPPLLAWAELGYFAHSGHVRAHTCIVSYGCLSLSCEACSAREPLQQLLCRHQRLPRTRARFWSAGFGFTPPATAASLPPFCWGRMVQTCAEPCTEHRPPVASCWEERWWGFLCGGTFPPLPTPTTLLTALAVPLQEPGNITWHWLKPFP